MVKKLTYYKNFNIKKNHQKSIILIGNFDGVHKGHASVISRACAEPGVALAMSFDPHPLSLINPQRAPLMLSSLNHRQTLIPSVIP